MVRVAALVCVAMLWFAVSLGAADAPTPRLEVYATATGTRPWRVRLVGQDGAALFVHSSSYATEAAAVARAEEIRSAMGSTVEIRYPSWVPPAPAPAADPLAVRALHAATPDGTLLADLIARWGPPTYYGRWTPIAASAPWGENAPEERQAIWNTEDGTYQWGVEYDRTGRTTGRGVSWSVLPTEAPPWAR